MKGENSKNFGLVFLDKCPEMYATEQSLHEALPLSVSGMHVVGCYTQEEGERHIFNHVLCFD